MLPLTYTYPYNTAYNNYAANTSHPAPYTCTIGDITYDPYTTNSTFANNSIQIQTSTAVPPGGYYITNTAYTIGSNYQQPYTTPITGDLTTNYWHTIPQTIPVAYWE